MIRTPGSVDSGGVPWAGRQVEASPFAQDDGRADEAVRARMAALAAAADGTDRDRAEADVLRALLGARVLAPVVALPAQAGADDDDGAQMATVVLTGPDGRRALPVFTGLDTLTAWDPSARPVPTAAPAAARAAIDESCDVLLLDLGAPEALVLRLSQVWALAQEREWRPAHADLVVAQAVERAVHEQPGLVAAQLHGDGPTPGALRLELTLEPGLGGAAAEAVVAALGERLAGDPEVRIRIDDLAVSLHPGMSRGGWAP